MSANHKTLDVIMDVAAIGSSATVAAGFIAAIATFLNGRLDVAFVCLGATAVSLVLLASAVIMGIRLAHHKTYGG